MTRPLGLVLLAVLFVSMMSAGSDAGPLPVEFSPGDPDLVTQAQEQASFPRRRAGATWQFSNFNASNLPGIGLGNFAVWVGETATQEPGWSSAPGYGNNWDTVLECHFQVADPAAGQTVALDFDFNYDTEPSYDIFSVEYETNAGWQPVLELSGSNKDGSGVFQGPGLHFPTDVAASPIAYFGNDYGGVSNDQVGIRFHFRSDGAWSDEDGSWDTQGAVQIDNISVVTTDVSSFEDFQNFDSLDSICWTPRDLTPPPPPPPLGCIPPIPSHVRTVNFGTRGYWFEAPMTFDISSLRAPVELGSDPQSVEVVLIKDQPADFLYSKMTSNITQLAYFQQVTGGQEIVLAQPLRIKIGDRIGILGGTTTNGSSTLSSYSASLPGPFASDIAGFPTTFFRLASNQSVTAGPVTDVFYSPYTELGRFEFTVLNCEPVFDCACTPNWAIRNGSDPTARVGAAMAYDTIRDRTVLFGGRDRQGNYLNDTWEYDGTSWTEMAPANMPSPRYLSGVAFNSSTGNVVLYGGSDSDYLGDTWEYDGTNWTQTVAEDPGDRHYNMGMAYDPLRNLVVRYGGSAPGGRDIATMEYDGTAWSLAILNSPPGYRSGHAMAFDPALGKILMYGGQAPGGTYKGDTWTYDGTWVQLAIAGAGAIQHHTLAADLGCGGVYLYGGIPNSTTVRDELWKFDSGAWTKIPGGSGAISIYANPGKRSLHSMVYEASSGGLLLTGGSAVATNALLSVAGTYRYACGQNQSWYDWGGTPIGMTGSSWGQVWPDSLMQRDHLVIMNVGASGEDGIFVNYGDAKSLVTDFNPPLPPSDSGNPSAAFDFKLRHSTNNDIEDDQFITMSGSPNVGGTGFTVDYGAIGATGYRAEAWHNGVLVASQSGLANQQLGVVIPDAIGSVRSIAQPDNTVTQELVIADPTQTSAMLLNGVPVDASRVVFVAENATVPVTHLTQSLLRGTNYGSMFVSRFAFGMFGSTSVTGVGDLVTLRGESSGNALRLTFSPQDGVADEGVQTWWSQAGSCEQSASLTWTPLEGGAAPAAGATIRLEAIAGLGGVPGTDLGSLELSVTNPVPGALEMDLTADYTAMGSTTQRVQVFNAGVLVGEFPGNTGAFMVTAPEMPTGAQQEMLKLAGYDTAGFDVLWPSSQAFELTLPGAGFPTPIPLLGDEIRVLAENPSGIPNCLESFSILADGFTEMVLVSSDGTAVAAPPVSGLASLKINRVYPNPFNPRVAVYFETAQRGPVFADVYNLAGRRVSKLLSGDPMGAGPHELVWDGTDGKGRAVSSGVYFIRMSNRDKTATVKVSLVR